MNFHSCIQSAGRGRLNLVQFMMNDKIVELIVNDRTPLETDNMESVLRQLYVPNYRVNRVTRYGFNKYSVMLEKI